MYPARSDSPKGPNPEQAYVKQQLAGTWIYPHMEESTLQGRQVGLMGCEMLPKTFGTSTNADLVRDTITHKVSRLSE